MFEKFFSVEPGAGYPPHRKEPQKEGKRQLVELSNQAHLPMSKAVLAMNPDVVKHALAYPGVLELLDIDTIADAELKDALKSALA